MLYNSDFDSIRNSPDAYNATGPARYQTVSYRSVEPAPGGGKKGKGGRRAGLVAGVLALSLVSGAAGGGATYLMLNQAQPPALTAAVEQEAPAAETPSVIQNESGSSAVSGNTDVASIVAKTSASVVEIGVETVVTTPFFGQQTTGGSGSGVILSEDGYIVTNDHVVEGATAITVRTQDGTEYEAALIGTDSKTDLAVVKVEATGLQPATFADSDSIEVGELAVAIGNPLGTLGGTVTNGIISAKDREITIGEETMTLLQTSAALNPGNSGGGLFNADGNLIGVVNAKSSGSQVEGLGFAIPSNTVRRVVDDIIENGYVTGRPEFGVSVIYIGDSRSALMYRVEEYGLYVAEVTRENGFRQGDRIISVDGVEIETGSELKAVLADHKAGDALDAVVKRDGREQAITVTLGESVPDYVQEQVAGEDL